MSTQIHITNTRTNEAQTFRTQAQAQGYIKENARDGYVAKRTYHAKVFGVKRTDYTIEFSPIANAVRNIHRVTDVLKDNKEQTIAKLMEDSDLPKMKKAELIRYMKGHDIPVQSKHTKADLLRICGEHGLSLHINDMANTITGDPANDEALIASIKEWLE